MFSFLSCYQGSKNISTNNSIYFDGNVTAVLTLRNVSFQDGGYYSCAYRGRAGSSLTNIQVGGEKILYHFHK